MFERKEGKVRKYERGMKCIVDVYDMCVYSPAMEKTHTEKRRQKRM